MKSMEAEKLMTCPFVTWQRSFDHQFDHKRVSILLLIACMALAFSSSIYRSTDYVVTDADYTMDDSKITVSPGNQVSVDVIPRAENFRSVLIHVGGAEGSDSDAALIAELFHDDTLLTSTTINSSDEDLGLENADRSVELMIPDGTPQYESYHLTLRAADDASSGSWLTAKDAASQNVWYRCTYRLFTNSQRVLLDVCGLLGLLILLFVVVSAVKNPSPEKLFLIASVVLGVLYFFLLPSELVPDSANHYVRSYLITKGVFLLPNGGMVDIPANLLPFRNYSYTWYSLLHNFQNSIDWSHTEQYDAVNMALYSPVNYVFQACGIGLAEVFSNNTNVLQAAGELANYSGCTALIYYAIKKIPYGKTTLAVISLVPLAMQERMSLSADALSYAAVAAMTAFVLYERNENKEMGKKGYAAMYILLVLLASCKIVYFITGLLIVLIPTDRFGTGRKAVVHKIIGMAVLFVMSLGWIAIAASGYLGNTRGGSSANVKMDILLHQPARYVYIVNKTILEDGIQYLFEMIGSKLGPTNIIVSDLVIFAAVIVLTWTLRNERIGRLSKSRRAAAFMLLISAAVTLLVMTSLYIQWTEPVAATYSIEGIQGRYFLPIMPVFLLAFLVEKSNTGERKCVSDGTASCIGTNSFSRAIFVIYAVNLMALLSCWNHQSYIG